MSNELPTTREALRVLGATLAYRAARVIEGAPPEFATTELGATTRTPVRIVAHMADLMTWAIGLARGEYSWNPEGSDDWDAEVARFYERLAELDEALASEESLRGPVKAPVEKLLQGPLADALTHVGQLAMLRRIAGAPVGPESYARAEIVIGRVGLEQAPPRAGFDGDASTRR